MECLARKKITPTSETIEDKLASWLACLTAYAQWKRLQSPGRWAARTMKLRPRGKHVLKLPPPAVAMAWLDILGRSVTLHEIEELAPCVMRIGHVSRREVLAWQALVSRGELPTPPAIAREARVQETRLPDDLAGREHDVVEFVAQFVARHRKGPTWKEAGSSFGWSNLEANAAIRCLAGQGMLSFTDVKRSLRPAPAG